MQYVYGALLLLLFIAILIALATLVFWLNDRKRPGIPMIVKSSHYIYGRLLWRLNWLKRYIDPVQETKNFKIVNWNEGIIETKIPLEIGDILVVRGRRRQLIAIMVIFFNGRDSQWFEYETAFIGVYNPQ